MTMECAARLAELRREKGLSQEELAEKLAVSRQAVSKWERGESSPDTDNLIALAQLYGVSLDVLLGLKLAQTPEPAETEYEAPAEEVEVDVRLAEELPPEPMPAALFTTISTLPQASMAASTSFCASSMTDTSP